MSATTTTTTYTETQLRDLFALDVDSVRYDYATTRVRHGKKGKKTIQSGGAYFSLRYKSGAKISLAALVRLANELDNRGDTDKAQRLEPFCRSLISRSVINSTKCALLKHLGLPVSADLDRACAAEDAKNAERTKKRLDKILSILEDGREKYIKNEGKRARSRAGSRYDDWELEYGNKGTAGE